VFLNLVAAVVTLLTFVVIIRGMEVRQ